MPLTPAFTVSQSGLTPNSVSVQDTSTGADAAITGRRIYISQADGTYLTGNGTLTYTVWLLANTSITLAILTEDIGANIRVDWIDVNGAILYTLNNNYPLPEFNQQFTYSLVQQQGLTPGIYQDTNYKGNLAELWVNIVAGINAVTYGNDIAAAQVCFSRATYMRLNENLFF